MEASKADVVILGLLADEPLYGYQLLERFRERGMGRWMEVGKASVYQGLRRLEREGMVSGRAQDGTEGPDRRVYKVTRAGRERLRRGLVERFGDPSPLQTEAALAFGFSHLVSADEARRGVAAREAALTEARARIAEERKRLASAAVPGRAVAERMLEQQDALVRAEGAWLASFKRDLGKLRR